MLENHKKKYRKFQRKFKKEQAKDRWSLENLRKELIENPIHCIKFNYTLDK